MRQVQRAKRHGRANKATGSDGSARSKAPGSKMRTIATWAHGVEARGDAPAIQASLKVNAPGDKFEQEAEQAASRVMEGSGETTQKGRCACGKPLGPGGMCEDCRREQEKKVRRTASGAATPGAMGAATAPTMVQHTLQQPGRPLDKPTRHFMEARFGRDFGHVRVHTGRAAQESSEAIGARAYTHGANIVFNQGQFKPQSTAGRRLLAHELMHVVQQQGRGRAAPVQRDEEKPKPAPDAGAQQAAGGAAQQAAKKVDVSLLLDDSADAEIEAKAYANIVIRATSGEDAAKQLKALGQPIGTIFVVSHSNRAGEVQVISGIGTISWQKLSDFSQKLKGALPAGQTPDLVDFRGCKLGEAPGQLETFRQNISATRAQATNCWSFSANATPLTAPDGSDITTPAQIPKGMEKQFDRVLRQHINNLQAENGVKVKDCIIGLAPGEKASKSFAKIKQIYFAKGGHISAGWASPDFNKDWQKDSICAKDMTTSTSPCKLVVK